MSSSSSRNKKDLQSQNDSRQIEISYQNSVFDIPEALLQKSLKKIEEENKFEDDSQYGNDQTTGFLQKMNDKNVEQSKIKLIYIDKNTKQINNNDVELPYNNGCCNCFSVSKGKSLPKSTTTQKIPTFYENIPDLFEIISNCNLPVLSSVSTNSYQSQSFIPQSKTFEYDKLEKPINLSIQSLRSDEQNISQSNLHDLAIKILSHTSKRLDSVEYQINNRFIEISQAFIFNQSFLSMPIKYKSNNYILCGQINPDEFYLKKLQKQFIDEYEDNNQYRYLLSESIDRNKNFRFFIAKVNKKINSKTHSN